MFILEPTRAYPSRYRISEDSNQVSGTLYEYDGLDALISTQYPTRTNYIREWMYDVEHGQTVNDVVHQKEFVTYPIYNGAVTCDIDSYYIYDDAPALIGNPQLPGGHLASVSPQFLPYDEFLKTREFQDAALECAKRYHDTVYHIQPEQLPDMTVFIAEIKELSGIFSIILGFAKQIISGLRTLRSIKKRQRRIWRDIKNRKVRDELLKKTRDSVREVSSDILGWRFGIMAPIRDITKIIAAMYGYIDTFEFRPFKHHVREKFTISRRYGPEFSPGCLHLGEECPFGQSTGAACFAEIEGYVCITSDIRNRLTGSTLEKVIAALLGQFGMLPSLDSLWELVHLSWLVDYFFRTSALLVKVEESLKLGPNDPIIEDTTVSLSIKETISGYHPCYRHGLGLGPTFVGERNYYERLVTQGRDLLKVVKMLRGPLPGAQRTNAIAYLTALLLSR